MGQSGKVLTPGATIRSSCLQAWQSNSTMVHYCNCEKAPYRQLEPGSSSVTGYFVTDFSLQDLRALTAVQPLPFRSSEHNGENIAQVSQVFALFKAARKNGSTAGLYMELKHPQYHAALVCPNVPSAWLRSVRNLCHSFTGTTQLVLSQPCPKNL